MRMKQPLQRMIPKPLSFSLLLPPKRGRGLVSVYERGRLPGTTDAKAVGEAGAVSCEPWGCRAALGLW